VERLKQQQRRKSERYNKKGLQRSFRSRKKTLPAAKREGVIKATGSQRLSGSGEESTHKGTPREQNDERWGPKGRVVPFRTREK